MTRAQVPLLLPLLVLVPLLAGCTAPSAPAGPAAGAAVDEWAVQCTPAAAGGSLEACFARVSTGPRTKAETWAAVNPKDPQNVLVGVKDMDPAKSNACVWVSYYATHDGGATWKDVTPGRTYADRLPPDPAFGWACNTDPAVTFGADGTAYAIVELYGFGKSASALLSGGTRIMLFTSHDGGSTWPESVDLIAGDGLAMSPDHPRVVASPTTGTVVASFIDYVVGDRCWLVAVRQGRADPPVLVVSPGSSGCQMLAVAPDGTWLSGGFVYATTPTSLWFTSSTDDAQSWSPMLAGFPFSEVSPTNAQAGTGVPGQLAAAAGPKGARFHAIYHDNATGDGDILLRWSDDAGASWSDPVHVSHDASGHQQYMPNIAAAPDGTLHAVYFDRRWDPADKLLDLTHAWSSDNGTTWQEQRVTSRSFDGDLGKHQDGYPWIGDYLGIAATERDVWIAAPDTSAGGEPVLAVAHASRGK